MVAGECPERWPPTASIKGSITAFVGRSGSSRASARTCTNRAASGDNSPGPRDQTVPFLQLSLLDATATCEALVRVLDQPAIPIPVHALPGLFKRGGGDRGKPHPFQRLLASARLLFPDTNDPHGQGLLARSWRVRVGARASSAQRQAGVGSNGLDAHAWLEPRTHDSPGWGS